MNYDLPKTLNVGGTDFAIRWDYRAALDICAALSDPELDLQSKGLTALMILYVDFDDMPPEIWESALREAYRYLNGGEEERPGPQRPQLISWEQDFRLIAGAVNRVLGKDVRAPEPLHWWTFLSAYMEIGECAFSHIVGIRAKKAKGKALTKEERAFYRENREDIDIRKPLTSEEEDLVAEWMAGAAGKR